MEDFIATHQSEIFASGVTVLFLLLLRLIINKTVHRIGRISDIVEARTILITKYVSTLLALIGFGALAFIWGVNFKDLGLLFSSVFAVIGVALFASWSILSNITAGVVLFFSFPFKIGDRVRVMDKDTEPDETYLIEDIKAFHVNLRKPNGELLVYPNNLMIQKAILVISHHDEPLKTSEDA